SVSWTRSSTSERRIGGELSTRPANKPRGRARLYRAARATTLAASVVIGSVASARGAGFTNPEQSPWRTLLHLPHGPSLNRQNPPTNTHFRKAAPTSPNFAQKWVASPRQNRFPSPFATWGGAMHHGVLTK